MLRTPATRERRPTRGTEGTKKSPGALSRSTRRASGPSPRAVLLDAAGTLIDVVEPLGETYARIARNFGGDLAPDALAAGFRAAFHDMPPMAFPGLRGAALDHAERGWWRTVVRRAFGEAGGGVPEFDACFDHLYACYASARAWRVFPEVPAVLAALRERGAALAVVSNFDSRLPPLLDAMGFAGSFDAVVCSGEAGAAKPDPAIFTHALAALGVEESQALHVGDSREADYDGARAAGIEALLVDRRATEDHADVITDLRGILDRF